MNLEGKSVIVTGAARGLGLGIARALLDEGALVTAAASTEETASEARERLGAGDDQLATVASDVSTVAGCEAVAAAARKAFGGIHGLVTNAGLYGETTVEGTDEPFWDRIIDTNLKSTFFSIKAALPSLRERHGAVVTIASYNGVHGVSGNAAVYGAAKAAVVNLTKTLALDLAPQVRVNSIAPGFIETEKLLAADGATELIEALGQMTPTGRIGRPEEVAHAVVYTLESDFLTGAVINLDGGRSAGR
jgi:3-oxoacyl-[acyl-carrier protein] reductase